MSNTKNPDINFSLFNKKEGTLKLTAAETQENTIKITLAALPSNHSGEVRVLVQNINEERPFYLKSESAGTNSLLIDLSPLREMAVFGRQTSFCFFIECTLNGKQVFYTLREQEPPASLPERYRIFAAEIWLQGTPSSSPMEYLGIAANKKDFKNLFCAALCSRNRYLELTHTCRLRLFCAALCSRNRYLELTHTCRLRSCRMTGGILKLKFDLETGFHKYVKTVFTFRSKLAEDAVSYDFQTVSSKKCGNILRITAALDLKTVDLISPFEVNWPKTLFPMIFRPSHQKNVGIYSV